MPQTSTDRDRLLRIYLDDHRAGAAGGVALARRMLEKNPDNYLTSTLRELTDEIDGDRDVLDDVIAAARPHAESGQDGHVARQAPGCAG